MMKTKNVTFFVYFSGGSKHLKSLRSYNFIMCLFKIVRLFIRI